MVSRRVGVEDGVSEEDETRSRERSFSWRAKLVRKKKKQNVFYGSFLPCSDSLFARDHPRGVRDRRRDHTKKKTRRVRRTESPRRGRNHSKRISVRWTRGVDWLSRVRALSFISDASLSRLSPAQEGKIQPRHVEREEGEGNSRKRRRRRGGKRFALPREPSNWPSIEPIDGGRARQRRRLSAGPSRAAERCFSRPRREGDDTPYAPREWNRCRQRLLRWEKTGSPRLLPTSDNARAEASIETKTR